MDTTVVLSPDHVMVHSVYRIHTRYSHHNFATWTQFVSFKNYIFEKILYILFYINCFVDKRSSVQAI